MKWFKFYGQDWLTDLKVMKMTMEDRLCFITLLALASASDEQGVVKGCDEESLIKLAHIPDWPESDYNPTEKASGCLKRYVALRCVTLADNGDVTVLNFARRQGENLSNAERQKNYRERHKTAINKGSATVTKRNDSNVAKSNDRNARIDKNRIDKNIDTSEQSSAGIVEVIENFKDVNPSYERLFPNKNQRSAAERLLKKYGREKVLGMVKSLESITSQKYAPKITTPIELERDLGKLVAFYKQNETKKKLVI